MPDTPPFTVYRSPRRAVRLLCALSVAAAAALFPSSAHAQLPLVSAMYTQSGGIFTYNFSVTNLTLFTLVDVNVTVPTGVGSVSNLSAPTGFQITFDPGLGLVDFLADADPATPQDFVSGSTVSGFLFDSSVLLVAPPFNALDDQGNSYNGTVIITPAVAAAPEPGTLSLLALSGVAIAALAARRRRFADSSYISRSLKG